MVEYASGELRPVEDAIMNLRSISSKQNDVKVTIRQSEHVE
jgi:hypothetical protein